MILFFLFGASLLGLNACSQPVHEIPNTYYATFEFDEKDIISMYDDERYFEEPIQRICYAYDYVEKDAAIIQYDLANQKSKRKDLDQLVVASELNLEQIERIVESMKAELQSYENEYAELSSIFESTRSVAPSEVVQGEPAPEEQEGEPMPEEQEGEPVSEMEEENAAGQFEDVEEQERIAAALAELDVKIKDIQFELKVEEKTYGDALNMHTHYSSDLEFYTNMSEYYRAPVAGYILSVSCSIKEDQLYIGQLIPADMLRLHLIMANDDERSQFEKNDIVMVKIDLQWYTSSVVNISGNTIELEVSGDLVEKADFYNPVRVEIKKVEDMDE